MNLPSNIDDPNTHPIPQERAGNIDLPFGTNGTRERNSGLRRAVCRSSVRFLVDAGLVVVFPGTEWRRGCFAVCVSSAEMSVGVSNSE